MLVVCNLIAIVSVAKDICFRTSFFARQSGEPMQFNFQYSVLQQTTVDFEGNNQISCGLTRKTEKRKMLIVDTVHVLYCTVLACTVAVVAL